MTPLRWLILALTAIAALSSAANAQAVLPPHGRYAGKFTYWNMVDTVGFTITSTRIVKAVNTADGFFITCARQGNDTVHGKVEKFEIQLVIEPSRLLAKVRHVSDPNEENFTEGTWKYLPKTRTLTVLVNTDGSPPNFQNIPPHDYTKLTLRLVKPLPN